MNSLINPFELLGLNVNKHINLKEVRKTYHSLSLLCHPDKGGNKTDFIVIHQAYQYVLEQVEQSKEMVPLDELENDFNNYCEEHPVEKLPSLLDIRDNATVFNQKFNEVWNENNIQNTNFNHFSGGYGDLMDRSELTDEQKENKTDDSNIQLTNQFTSDLMIYEEPNALPENYGTFQRFDVTEVNNYGNLPEQLYDYKETYSQVNEKIEVPEDKPMTDFEKLLKEREQEREQFQKSLNDERREVLVSFKQEQDRCNNWVLDDDIEEI